MKIALTLSLLATLLMVYLFGHKSGQLDATESKLLIVASIACKDADFESKLDTVDIPDEWTLASVIESKPEVYQVVKKNIMTDCKRAYDLGL
ncbi:hypothetical protein L1D14_07375 [Vibrio tubiashii]|uniref:hypothetical protein n=1 Tax=Vibrio tubiashii TaxID=29498 RepID=UPI001EFD5EE4|nr:hypothetical protein [Vibrio tubiashii]MCG9576058.1 hypothetical protein [Vibrio tubiashii]